MNAAGVARRLGGEVSGCDAILCPNIIGINISLPDTCRCASDIAVVCAGDATHNLSLKCRSCERHRGWLSKPTADWISSVAAKFGAPAAAITIRSDRIAKACAKQDEYLKRKYTPTGKSWFDVITENFDVPSPSGTGEEQDSLIGAENRSSDEVTK
jgi:hypothetical protein